jgi:hypothetical protein
MWARCEHCRDTSLTLIVSALSIVAMVLGGSSILATTNSGNEILGRRSGEIVQHYFQPLRVFLLIFASEVAVSQSGVALRGK